MLLLVCNDVEVDTLKMHCKKKNCESEKYVQYYFTMIFQKTV